MTAPRVLLTTLSIRTAASGHQYLSGYLGKARVVAFTGEPDKFGNETWDVYLSEPEPRQASGTGPRPQGGGLHRDGDRIRAGRTSARAHRDRAASEALERYGDPEQLNDALPF